MHLEGGGRRDRETQGEVENTMSIVLMRAMKLDQNYLTGRLPAFIENFSAMQFLSVGINALSGPIPKELGKLQNLLLLYIDSSGLSGELPSTLSNLKNLEILRFQGNSFEGPISSSLSNLSKLTDLWSKLSFGCRRIGDITSGSPSLDFVSNMTSLSNLVLRNCKISDTIPSSFGQFLNLQQLDLSYNQPSGSFPSWVSQPNLKLNLVANNFVIDSSNNSILPSGLNCLQRNIPCSLDSPIY
uniref:Disease resistance R13L4/SHOC-2-like LRR domain-containing protein n=1 Tax=Ananas comosus var. bracteatus TaxID=296719 RepID=A0A6V7QVQ7_ANACO